MTEEEAVARARQLNDELGQVGDLRRFYVAREVRPGEWDVIEHRKRSWRVLLEQFLSLFPGSPNF